ncbi:L,D-transpeptidase family protein [Streptomyces sp. TRM43335]|uniref:L,D-transpeptidase family protein n=1 Tax=Streptomyces taklimakanensis TaxID=2569853 RepID=A0A6G2BF48_9ACTN|nr:L,D-transpeptidase family protein [Streptomyces taklimakanensis]MTE20699.1 L,D-transpeptidase family protein [Streptomyces taklimakanensis]
MAHGPRSRAALAAVAVMLLGAGCAADPAGARSHLPAGTMSPAAPPTAGDAPTPTPTPTATPTPTRTPPPAPSAPAAASPTSRSPRAEPVERSTTRTPEASATPTPSRTTAAPPMLREGARGEKVRELQARLRQAGHFDLNPTGYYGTITSGSVSAFQRTRGLPASGDVTRETWDSLTARTRTPTRQELYPPTTRPVTEPDPRCLTGRVMCVSKESRTLVWMIDGRALSAMDVRFGSELTPTREGVFAVSFKSRHHHSTLYDTPMPYAMFFSGGQAVHYSADFAANGYNGASHGCVNVRDKEKIATLFDQVEPGDKVIVY